MNNNLNFMRLALAISVVYSHSYPLSGSNVGDLFSQHFIYSCGNFAVMSFFVVSGFLMVKSFNNSGNVFIYFWHRFLRIYPALWMSILLAVILGFISQNQYGFINFFTDQETISFVKINSLLYSAAFNLPGVFKTNYWPNGVNGSLWTLPLEVRMYLFVAFLGVFSVLEKKYFNLLFLILLIFGVNMSYPIFAGLDPTSNSVCAFFLMGMFWQLNGLKFNNVTFFICLIISFFALKGKLPFYFLLFSWSYCLLYIAFIPNIFRGFFNRIGDYSYGVYVYSFLIQQFIVHWFMLWFSTVHLEPLLLFIISICISFVLSVFSWHFIESKCLRLKNKLDKFIPKEN